MSASGVGAPLPRKEDDRLMRGRGRFVADIQLAGTRDVAFLRSPVAHAKIGDIEIPEDKRDRMFTAADMAAVKPIRAASTLPGFKVSEQPVLATGKVRHVGELVAMCLGDSRADAEDLAGEIFVDFEDLPAVSDMLRARDADAARLHDHWPDNVYLETAVDTNFDAAVKDAEVSVTRTFHMARQCMAPLEGRAVLATWDRHVEQLLVYSATQLPHIVRAGLAECLGLDQGMIRVVAPDVGGGFGYKGILAPEEVAIAWLAMQCDHPVRWIEDRREHLTAAANAREHHYEVTLHADRSGRIVALDAEAIVDAGAYSAYPFSACLEAAQVASILPGPYDFPGYRCRTWSVASNKPPILPYRGVARTGVCFAMELMIDALAHELGREPHEIRLANLVPAAAMPFDNITAKHFDSGDYQTCLQRAVEAIDIDGVRARQRNGADPLIGVGLAIFTEQAAHGTSVYRAWGIPMIPGWEQATARFSPDGILELRTGVHSHGQGLETTLAQIANETLGIDPGRVRVVLGDTALTPYSTGTWGSRCTVMAGGAVAEACRVLGERVAHIGAHLLQADAASVRIEGGAVVGGGSSVALADVAHCWYRAPHELPDDVDPGGLEVSMSYKPERDSGTFSYAAHAAVVAVDPDLGGVEILDYVVVEDGGTLINPLIVDGQVLGGAAQGIGTALYEEMPFDDQAQPLASTLADYLLPGATEMPDVRIEHMATPSPYTRFGQKGIGEGGAVAPPAAIANAINDALRPLGVEVTETPISPRRLRAAVAKASA